MENKNYANATLDDIVFEGRNREYGAYVLRQVYNKHVTRGLFIAIALFILFLAAPVISKKLFPEEEVVHEVVTVDVNTLAEPPPIDKATPPPPPPPVEPPPPPEAKTIKFTPPVVKKDEEVRKEEVPDIDKIKEAQIDVKTQEGDPNAKPDLSGLEGNGNAVVQEVVEEEIFVAVEQSAEFPGGAAEMYKWLQKNLKYPALAQRNGIEGRVMVQFVVDQQGNISDINVLRDPGGGTREEAIRVVKSMPKWTPPKQNGRAVKQRLVIPINFKLS